MTTQAPSTSMTFEHLAQWERLPAGMTLHEAAGVSVAADDTVYVIGRNPANPVIVFTSDGEFLRTWGAGTFTPRAHAILAAHDGFIYCADDGVHTITKWTPEGELVMTIGTPNEPSPRFSGQPFNRPTDMVVTADGSIIISDGYGNARVHKYSADGKLLKSWGEPGIEPGQFMLPHNLGLDGDRVYVADREAHRLQVFSTDGELLEVWNNIHRPAAVTVGPGGYVYVGELNAIAAMDGASGIGHRISIFDREGQLLSRFGGPDMGSEPGQFTAPHGIAVDSRGDVYLAEVSYTIVGSHLDPPRELRSISKLRRLT